jgi:hypothetical protein
MHVFLVFDLIMIGRFFFILRVDLWADAGFDLRLQMIRYADDLRLLEIRQANAMYDRRAPDMSCGCCG